MKEKLDIEDIKKLKDKKLKALNDNKLVKK